MSMDRFREIESKYKDQDVRYVAVETISGSLWVGKTPIPRSNDGNDWACDQETHVLFICEDAAALSFFIFFEIPNGQQWVFLSENNTVKPVEFVGALKGHERTSGTK